jgi:hypothetical protein
VNVICNLEMIQCRLPVNRLDTDRHVTFPLLFNGYLKDKALHLSSNLHLAFHVKNGLILGGAGYPGMIAVVVHRVVDSSD